MFEKVVRNSLSLALLFSSSPLCPLCVRVEVRTHRIILPCANENLASLCEVGSIGVCVQSKARALPSQPPQPSPALCRYFPRVYTLPQIFPIFLFDTPQDDFVGMGPVNGSNTHGGYSFPRFTREGSSFEDLAGFSPRRDALRSRRSIRYEKETKEGREQEQGATERENTDPEEKGGFDRRFSRDARFRAVQTLGRYSGSGPRPQLQYLPEVSRDQVRKGKGCVGILQRSSLLRYATVVL